MAFGRPSVGHLLIPPHQGVTWTERRVRPTAGGQGTHCTHIGHTYCSGILLHKSKRFYQIEADCFFDPTKFKVTKISAGAMRNYALSM